MWNKLRGFGLIEVMVALLITSIGIVGIFQVQQLLIFQEDEITRMSGALSLARTRLAAIYTDPSTAAAEPDEVVDELYHVVISQQPVEHMDGLWLVLVTVSWDDLRGNSHQVSLSSRIEEKNTNQI